MGGVTDQKGKVPSVQPRDEDPLGPTGDLELDLDDDAEDDLGDEAALTLDVGAFDVQGEETRAAIADEPFHEDVEIDTPDFDDHGAETADDSSEDDGALALDEGLPDSHDDGGAEGLGDGSESLIDEGALPAMDEGVAGDFELADLLDELGFGKTAEWEPCEALGSPLSVLAVDAADGLVVAVGMGTALLEPGSETPRIRMDLGAAHACAVAHGHAYAANGSSIVRLGATEPPAVLCELFGVERIAVAAGKLFALAEGNVVHVDPATGKVSIVRHEVTSIAAAHATLFISTKPGQIERLRGQDGDFEAMPLDARAEELVRSGGTILAASSRALLLTGDNTVLCASARTAARVDLSGVLSACPLGVDSFLVVTGSQHELALYVVGEAGQESCVAEWRRGADWPEISRAGVAWDSSRETAFVACAKGLLALRPRVRH